MNQTILFRKLVFAQVLLGVVAYCIAERNPALLLIIGALAALSWPVSEGPSGKPMPQWVIVPAAFPAIIWLMIELARQESDVIPAMCHFMMWLQVLLLYSKKNNYDYGQLLVLSLMQMIGASVLSISLIYGVLLAAYCVLAIFTILVFQLKHTSDLVIEANRAASPNPARVIAARPVTGRNHQWHFAVSAIAIGSAAGGVGVLVFLIMPRSASAQNNDADPFGLRQAGFTSRVQLTGAPPYLGNRQPVLHLSFPKPDNGASVQTPARILLRGAALDQYDHLSKSWIRGPVTAIGDKPLEIGTQGRTLDPAAPPNGTYLLAHFSVRKRTERTLFSMTPITWIKSTDFPKVTFNPLDQNLELPEANNRSVEYDTKTLISADPFSLPVTGSVILGNAPETQPVETPKETVNGKPGLPASKTVKPQPGGKRITEYARGWHDSENEVQRLAFDIIHARGLDRDVRALSDPNDLRIAAALADYLRENFKYSLENPASNAKDTSNAPFSRKTPANPDDDPLHQFLFVTKKGHCELFAASLASLARSLGMQARVITGYLVAESSYNRYGEYYVVRESNAHAWTEINCAYAGWINFDATPASSDDMDGITTPRTFLSSMRDLYEHLEFAWVKTVVTYDTHSRDAAVANITDAARNVADEENWMVKAANAIKSFFDRWEFDEFSLILIGFIFISIGVGVGTFIRIMLVRHQRLVALQLTALPRAQRIQLVQRLKFYLVMLDMLERRGFVRPSWQSPFAFAKDLAKKYPERFDSVVHLSEIFYEIRFGYRDLDDERKGRIRQHLAELENALLAARPAATPKPA
jgi:hypothetical protein